MTKKGYVSEVLLITITILNIGTALKMASEINSRHHLPTRNENFSSEKSEKKELLTWTENVKNSPKNKIIRKSSKHEDVKSIQVKSQNSDMQPRQNIFKHRHRQNHYIEVVQGEIFIDQQMWFGLVLGQFAILKKLGQL